MYSHEIEQILKNNNYNISNFQYNDIIDTSSQINLIKYNPFENNFYIKTDDNYDFSFKVYKKERK